jgi:soluble lytic murein transglycosylase-like protein
MAKAELDKLVTSATEREGVNADLVRLVIGKESAAKPCAVSAKGARGLMQLMPATAAELGVKDAFDPQQNVDGGVRLLKKLLTKYGGDVPLALGAYNAGSGRVDQAGGVPQIPETLNYVSDIMSRLRVE